MKTDLVKGLRISGNGPTAALKSAQERHLAGRDGTGDLVIQGGKKDIPMKGKNPILLLFLSFLAALATPVSGGAAGHETGPIPPAEAGAKAALESSPRHHEWVHIAIPGKDAKVSAFVAYPERKEKAPVVIVIQEIYGLTDWIRAVADRLAADGFIAIAPDLLSRMGPGGGGTDKFASRDDVVKAVRGLKEPDVVAALDAVSRYG